LKRILDGKLFEDRSVRILLLALSVRILYLVIALSEVYRDTPLLKTDLLLLSSVDYWDIELRFYQFVTRIYKWGKIPYVNYPLEYPQLAGGLFQLLYSFQPGNFPVFALSLHLVQLPLELLTTLSIYKIAQTIYGERYASLVALLYNLYPMVLHTWVSRYDSIPVFLTVTALYLLLRRRFILSFLMIAIGTMFKWYPAVLLLPFLQFMRGLELSPKTFIRSLLAFSLFCFAVVAPFLFASPQFFLESYIFHLGRGWNYQSLWVLIIPILRGSSIPIFSRTISDISLLLQFLGCLSILLFRIKGSRGVILGSSYVLMVFVFLTKFYSPQYITWFTPFLILSLPGNLNLLYQITLHLVVYIEYPMLWNLRFSNIYPYFYWAVAAKFLLFSLGILRILLSLSRLRPRED